MLYDRTALARRPMMMMMMIALVGDRVWFDRDWSLAGMATPCRNSEVCTWHSGHVGGRTRRTWYCDERPQGWTGEPFFLRTYSIFWKIRTDANVSYSIVAYAYPRALQFSPGKGNKYECAFVLRIINWLTLQHVCSSQTLRENSPGGSTFQREMTSWPPSWKCDVKSIIRLRQSMRLIYLKNISAEFYLRPIWITSVCDYIYSILLLFFFCLLAPAMYQAGT